MPEDLITKPKKQYRRTISEELLGQWRSLMRRNDPEKIAKILRLSKPTIDKALLYGCVHRDSTRDGITQFFMDRLTLEREQAELLRQQSEITQTT